MKRLAFVLLLATTSSFAQTDSVLTLPVARSLALERNPLLQAAALREEEDGSKIDRARNRYLPVVTLQAGAAHFWEAPSVTVPAGSLGVLPLGGKAIGLPSSDLTRSGVHNAGLVGVMAYQPLTQLLQVSSGVQASTLDRDRTRVQVEQARRQILSAVEQLWLGVRVAQCQREEARLRTEAARERLKDAENALAAGKALATGTAGLSASLADEERNELEAQDRLETYESQLRNLIGADPATPLRLDTASTLGQAPEPPALEACLSRAREHSALLQESRLTVAKAQTGVSASRRAMIPELGVVAGCTWQNSIDAFPKQNPYVGALAQWNLLDVRDRSLELGERHLQVRQAQLKLQSQQDSLRTEVERTWRKLVNGRARLEAARRALDYRTQDLKVQGDRFQAGLLTRTEWLGVQAAREKSRGDAEGALAAVRLARLELGVMMGDDEP